ncbi:hypothetical protein C2869_03540 [Saccharobesus litoralis]|uniref:Uncharacterized protein n=1 Tax=Saccharobesus litoralis TaxID=2172099 RepID=A0A2S0VMX3_9ALTE|nr:discoidin domain-containing protein [Saccharobesus litoralis]AWB65564.1 hypothetical protein C2869_03540 [Saccharobesus litoralis]
MRHLLSPICAALCSLTSLAFLSSCSSEPNASQSSQSLVQVKKIQPEQIQHLNDQGKVLPLPAELALASMELQDGYKMELVAAEPLVEEPVLFTFDGNGRMYVAEMLTYMLDADGTGQMQPASRIKRLEDTDNDGVMDKMSVFADGLLLPRMIQTLDDGRILVRETNTFDLLLLEDTNGDGKADKRSTLYKGGRRGGNLEHQPSGLIYGIDNWMYVTYTDKRYRYRNGSIETQNIAYGGGQWGLGQDAAGRLYYSSAGGENPAFTFQFPSVYGKVSLNGEQAKGFREVFPLSTTPDVQGGLRRVRDDNTLNHFTAVGGQSVYLGDKLPELYGNYIAPEPVGNLVRRADITRTDGYSVLSHPYQNAQKEFIATRDPNFRPVWSDTAPDGTLMIADMYRGIIQEGNWTKEGSYLRGVIEKYGFDKVIGRGRIYRVTRPGVELGPQPRMYQETPSQLVEHLAHPNFWWRITAQKLLVIGQEKSVISKLKKMAESHTSQYARLHALWTLEGLGVVDKRLLISKFSDPDTNVRTAAVRISEQLVTAENDGGMVDLWSHLLKSADLETSQQIILSAFYVAIEQNKRLKLLDAAKQRFANSKSLAAVEYSMHFLLEQKAKMAKLAAGDAKLAESVARGEKNYKSLCYTCHGADAKGTPMGEGLLAPSFHNNKRIAGNLAILGRIMAQGLTGPIDGVNYGGGVMAPLASNDDQWVADVLNYLRNNYGNEANSVSAEQIKQVKALTKGRHAPWTQAELNALFANEITDKSGWKVTASHGQEWLNKINDGKAGGGRWMTRVKQQAGMWLQVELEKPYYISQVLLNNQYSKKQFPRGYQLEFSMDGENWQLVDTSIKSGFMLTSETLGYKTKFIRITLTHGSSDVDWKMNELQLFGSEA